MKKMNFPSVEGLKKRKELVAPGQEWLGFLRCRGLALGGGEPGVTFIFENMFINSWSDLGKNSWGGKSHTHNIHWHLLPLQSLLLILPEIKELTHCAISMSRAANIQYVSGHKIALRFFIAKQTTENPQMLVQLVIDLYIHKRHESRFKVLVQDLGLISGSFLLPPPPL